MTQASNTLDFIEQLRAGGEVFCVATVIRTANLTSAKAGAKAVVTKDGEIHGFVGGACVTGAVRKAALTAMSSGQSHMVRIRPKEEVAGDKDADGAPLYQSSCPSGGTVEIFLEPMGTARKVVICGFSPVAQALVAITKTLGFAVVHAGPSQASDRIDGADVYLDGYDLSDAGLQPGDSVVIATQGMRDREALRGALASPAAYVSMIGSRRKIATLRDALAKEGSLPTARLAALRGPAGFDIGAVGPEEIALSVVAEIVAFQRRPGSMTTPVL
ncbi:MAG: XdhC family protein [Alphaproteobacteria bacterium]